MPTERFKEYVRRNLAHWQQRLDAGDENQPGALEAERHNLYRALEAGLQVPEAVPDAARLARAMFPLVERGSYLPECGDLLRRTAAALEPSDPYLAADLLNQLGHLYRATQALETAIELHRRAASLALATGRAELQARCQVHLSEDFRLAGRLDEAEQAGQAALALYGAVDPAAGELGAAHNTLGLVAWMRGDRGVAISRLTEAAHYLRRAGLVSDMVRCLNNLANAHAAAGDNDAALVHFEEARALLAGQPHLLDLVMLENSLGTLLFNLGRLGEAEAAFRRADSPALRQSTHMRLRATTATNLGNVLHAAGALPEAEARLRGALALWEPLNDPVMEANVLGTLAEVLAAAGQADAAHAALDDGQARLARAPGHEFGRRLQGKFTRLREQWAARSQPAGT